MRAVFTGSFDPFTLGHDNIVRRALPMFSKIIIGVGHNERKTYSQTLEERVQTIREIYPLDRRIEVMAYGDLTVDFAKRMYANYIIKGVRSVKDFEYEREQAEINLRLSGIETVFFIADPNLSYISSSMVRELQHFGRDVSEFLPVRRPELVGKTLEGLIGEME